FNSAYTLQTLSVLPDWQYEYGSGTRGQKPTSQGEAVQYGRTSWGAPLDGSQVVNPDGETRPYVAQKDNFNRFYNDGHTINNNLAISGGNESVNFRLSVSDLKDKSIVPNFNYDRNTFDLNANATIADKIIVSGSAQYTIEKGGNRPGLNDFTYNPNASLYVMTNSVDVRTLRPGYDERGYETPWNDLTFAINPYFPTAKRDARDKRQRCIGNITTQYNILEELYIKGQSGIDFDYFKALNVTPTGSVTNTSGSMTESKRSFSEANLSLKMGFQKEVGAFS